MERSGFASAHVTAINQKRDAPTWSRAESVHARIGSAIQKQVLSGQVARLRAA